MTNRIKVLALAVALAGGAAPAVAGPRYRIDVRPVNHFEAEYTLTYRAPEFHAREWLIFVPRLIEMPNQRRVETHMEPPGHHLPGGPLMLARVGVHEPAERHRCRVVV